LDIAAFIGIDGNAVAAFGSTVFIRRNIASRNAITSGTSTRGTTPRGAAAVVATAVVAATGGTSARRTTT
jgi:hypothetical protein